VELIDPFLEVIRRIGQVEVDASGVA